LLGKKVPPTPLWNRSMCLPQTEEAISVTIDNSSVFVPGGTPQPGFRRTELIAQAGNNRSALDVDMESGVTVFHFSIRVDKERPLNYTHEYQIVFIEAPDGTHVFGIQLGNLLNASLLVIDSL
jgi:hypothetical protein